MSNSDISEVFSMLSKLMDINGFDSFKAKSYSITAYTIDKLPVQLSELSKQHIAQLKGIGASSAKKIEELLQTNTLKQLEELLLTTPQGVVELLKIKGLGPKKINTIWKEMELESMGELLYACKENRLKLFKGFGEKTQISVIENIEFYFRNKGSFLYAQLEFGADQFLLFLQAKFPKNRIAVTGEFKRQIEIITVLEFVIETEVNQMEQALATQQGLAFLEKGTDFILYKTVIGVKVMLHAAPLFFIEKCVETSSSAEFYTVLQSQHASTKVAATEDEYFSDRGLKYIPAFLRESEEILTSSNVVVDHLQPTDVKGLIHCHSNWSDGNNTIEEMANAARAKGMEYMAISDHSKTATYAQGLKEDQIKAQHDYIDELNVKLTPFKIFKSIESDILGDGSLDYSSNILSTFDIVIASVHSNLKMSLDKAMARLLAAIENPYTTVLGHLTGRLLLSRPGYPLDFKKIIDACAANDVAIELNANPNRLDMDWREIKYALQKEVLISVNPDAHSIKGIDDIKYGVLSAQKAMVPKEMNLSSFSLAAFDNYVNNRKKVKGI